MKRLKTHFKTFESLIAGLRFRKFEVTVCNPYFLRMYRFRNEKTISFKFPFTPQENFNENENHFVEVIIKDGELYNSEMYSVDDFKGIMTKINDLLRQYIINCGNLTYEFFESVINSNVNFPDFCEKESKFLEEFKTNVAEIHEKLLSENEYIDNIENYIHAKNNELRYYEKHLPEQKLILEHLEEIKYLKECVKKKCVKKKLLLNTYDYKVFRKNSKMLIKTLKTKIKKYAISSNKTYKLPSVNIERLIKGYLK